MNSALSTSTCTSDQLRSGKIVDPQEVVILFWIVGFAAGREGGMEGTTLSRNPQRMMMHLNNRLVQAHSNLCDGGISYVLKQWFKYKFFQINVAGFKSCSDFVGPKRSRRIMKRWRSIGILTKGRRRPSTATDDRHRRPTEDDSPLTFTCTFMNISVVAYIREDYHRGGLLSFIPMKYIRSIT